MLEDEEELVEYFLDLVELFLEDFLACFEDFFSNLFLSLVDEGLESSAEGDLLKCFDVFLLGLGILA